MSALVTEFAGIRAEIGVLPAGSTQVFHGALDAQETYTRGRALLDKVKYMPLGDTVLEAEFETGYMPTSYMQLPEAPSELEAIAAPLDALLPPRAERSLVRIREFNNQSQYHTLHIDNVDSPILDKRLVVIIAGKEGEWCEAGSQNDSQQLLRHPVTIGDIIAINNMCPERQRKLHMLITTSTVTALVLGWTLPAQNSGTLA